MESRIIKPPAAIIIAPARRCVRVHAAGSDNVRRVLRPTIQFGRILGKTFPIAIMPVPIAMVNAG